MSNLYWLSDEEWSRIEPLLPRGRRGAHRVDDRRVISGIIHMLRSGARWRDCPADYGPYTTIYNRFNRWSRQGIWHEMFEALTGSSGMIGTMAIDATYIKAHRSAAGAKGGLSTTPSVARAVGARRKSTPNIRCRIFPAVANSATDAEICSNAGGNTCPISAHPAFLCLGHL